MVAIKAEASFSLKDYLFNAESVAELSRALKLAYKRFDRKGFEGQVLRRFPELDLKQRINWMVTMNQSSHRSRRPRHQS